MSNSNVEVFHKNWKEIALTFLKLGATAYGGPAIIGVMQTELQEKRQWVSKERFIEALSLVNMLPGAAATQLGIFLGYSQGGWFGGLLAGLCFVLPAFFIMLVLTLTYAAFGATPLLHGALYGLGPVVMGIFLVAIYRLGKTAATSISQWLIAAVAALAMTFSLLGIVPILTFAGGIGVFLYYSRTAGAVVLSVLLALVVMLHFAPSLGLDHVSGAGIAQGPAAAPGLLDIGAFFLKIGALSFGGGLSLIAFIQDQVVNQRHWLTQREFIDGLALGQFTPGPILMVAAYVGYKLAGIAGAAVAAMAIFLPAFVLMLGILPMFERVRKLLWTKSAMKGIGPAVIGVLVVSLLQMAPHALPDPVATCFFVATIVTMLIWRVGAIKVMALGALLGVVRERLFSISNIIR